MERRWSAGSWQWTIGLRGSRKSFLWLSAGGHVPLSWGSLPSLLAAVRTYNEILGEGHALGIPATDVCWHGLLAALGEKQNTVVHDVLKACFCFSMNWTRHVPSAMVAPYPTLANHTRSHVPWTHIGVRR